MPELTGEQATAEAQVLRTAVQSFVPIYYFGKGYERDHVTAVADGGGISLTVDNPWAGRTGYGLRASISLDPAQAKALGTWLVAAALAAGR